MPLSHLFIPKNRIIDFELTILIQDLTNVPLVSGLYFVKWKIKNAGQSGSTVRAPIRDHCIYWGHPISAMAELVVSKQHMLGPCELKLEVYQELGGKDTILIGDLTINLSEYANSGLTTRRYLLDDCKFNSTIKLSIKVDQKSESLAPFNIPPLKKQQIFTDIPSMILERQDRSMIFEERSTSSVHGSSTSFNNPSNTLTAENSIFQSQGTSIQKSQSAISLPHYYRQMTPFNDSDDPSPTDLVEQLFKQKSPKATTNTRTDTPTL